MGSVGEEFLSQAIHNEIAARDIYESIAEKIDVPAGKRVMVIMSREEESHRKILTKRLVALTGGEFEFDESLDTGPDFAFMEKSTFGRTDAVEALSLCLGAEIDAIRFYSHELQNATESPDVKMLKSLIKFEKRHKKRLENELRKLRAKNQL